MTALSDVFPTTINQLCRWHIEQNILKNCRKYFTDITEFDDFMKSVKAIASQDLNHFKRKFPVQAVNYFLEQWWIDGKYERWAEICIRKNLNFGLSITSRVEGSHGAMKGALTSSSGTLYTPGNNKINRRDINRSEELSIIGSNENALVRLEIRNQIETAQLCTVISRPALELVYAEVIKKLHLQIVEGGTEDACSRSIWHGYLLPCLHRIQLGVPIDVADIHPRWRVHPVFPPLNINWAHIDPETLSNVKDPQVGLPRKG
ncbi:hypothetical protein V1505DRAFT_376989, partial [Lipomyces doorenjongii]